MRYRSDPPRPSSQPSPVSIDDVGTAGARWCRRVVLAGAAVGGGLLLSVLPVSAAHAYQVSDFGVNSEFSFDSDVDLRPVEITATSADRYLADSWDVTDMDIDASDTFDIAAMTVDLASVWKAATPAPLPVVPAPVVPSPVVPAPVVPAPDKLPVVPPVAVPPEVPPAALAGDEPPVPLAGDEPPLALALVEPPVVPTPEVPTVKMRPVAPAPVPAPDAVEQTKALDAGPGADPSDMAVAPVGIPRQQVPLDGDIAAGDEFGIVMPDDQADDTLVAAVDSAALDPGSSEIWSHPLPSVIGNESPSVQRQLADDTLPLQERFGGTLVAGPVAAAAPQGAEATPEFGLVDGDMGVESRYPGGDPGAAFNSGAGAGASDCLYFGAGGLFARGGIFGRASMAACVGFSGFVGGATASGSPLAQGYLGEFQPGYKYCISSRQACWTQGPGTFDPSDLAGGVVASAPECQTGYVLKGWPGCGVALLQGLGAYAAGAAQPDPEWTYEPPAAGPSLLDPLTAAEVRSGQRAVVAGLGTTAPVTMTSGPDWRVMGSTAGTGAVLGGLRTLVVTYSWQGALSNAGVAAFGYTVGSAPREVWEVKALSPRETADLDARIADNRARYDALVSQSPPPLGPEQFVTPELYEGLTLAADRASRPVEPDLRLAPVDAVAYRELLNQIHQAEDDIVRLEELRKLPPQAPGPENHVTQELVDGLIAGLGDPEQRLAELRLREKDLLSVGVVAYRDLVDEIQQAEDDIVRLEGLRKLPPQAPGPENHVTQELVDGLIAGLGDSTQRLAELRRREKELLAGGHPLSATIVEVVPSKDGSPAVYEVRSGSALLCSDGSLCLGLFSIVDGKVVDLEAVPLPPRPTPSPVPVPGPTQQFGGSFARGGQALSDSLDQVVEGAARVPGRVLPPDPWAAAGEPNPLQVAAQAWNTYGQPGADLALRSGTKYFGETLPAFADETLDVVSQALADTFSPPVCQGRGACPDQAEPQRPQSTVPAADVAALRRMVHEEQEAVRVLFDGTIELPTASSVFNQFTWLATRRGYTPRQAAVAVDGVYRADDYGLVRTAAGTYRVPPPSDR